MIMCADPASSLRQALRLGIIMCAEPALSFCKHQRGVDMWLPFNPSSRHMRARRRISSVLARLSERLRPRQKLSGGGSERRR